MTRMPTRFCFVAWMAAMTAGMAWAEERPELLPTPKECDTGTGCCKAKCCQETGCCNAPEAANPRKQQETRVFSVDKVLSFCERFDVKVETLPQVITNCIQPSTWVNGGGRGTIEYFPLGKALVVNQTTDIHEQVAELIRLCAARASNPRAETGGVSLCPQCVALEIAVAPGSPPILSAVPAPVLSTAVVQPIAVPPAAVCLPPPMPGKPCGMIPAPALEAAAAIPCYPGTVSAAPTVSGLRAIVSTVPQACWRMHAATVEDKATIAIQCGNQMCMTSDSLEITMPATGKLKLAACDGQICATSCCLHAKADAISCQNEGCVVFEGHVHLRYERDAQQATIAAERVTVNLTNGLVEMQPAVHANDRLKRVVLP